MKLKHYIYLSLLVPIIAVVVLWFLAVDKTNYESSFPPTQAQLLLPDAPIVAGSPLCLEVKITSSDPLELAPDLIWSSSYGTTIFTLDYEDSGLSCFSIPKSYTQQAGEVFWQLVSEQQLVDQGVLTILPDSSIIGEVATYLGPRSITANPRDYTMLVSVPTDHYDNLLPENTAVVLKTHYQGVTKTTDYGVEQGIVWQRIPAPLQSGRMSTTATVGAQSGKELVVDVFPDLATSFTIAATLIHPYADGNEQLTLKTSQIKDVYGNIIDDGTLITFLIENEQGQLWQTTGTTIQGFAFAKALHPETPSQWHIKAVIEGIVESPSIDITFKSILNEIMIGFSEDQRAITVGPLTSYLGQRIPDGIQVQLFISESDTPMEMATVDGFARFTLPEALYPAGDYTVEIQTLGITRTQKLFLQ